MHFHLLLGQQFSSLGHSLSCSVLQYTLPAPFEDTAGIYCFNFRGFCLDNLLTMVEVEDTLG